MAWTYTGSPGSVPRDAVRFALGDTDPSDPLMQDGEVDFALSDQGNTPKLAAAMLADRLAARFAREEAVSIDGISLSGSGRASAFRTLAAARRAVVARTAAAVASGAPLRSTAVVLTGVRQSDMAAADADFDRPRSLFRLTSPLGEDDTVIL